jgi:hypothetical protein
MVTSPWARRTVPRLVGLRRQSPSTLARPLSRPSIRDRLGTLRVRHARAQRSSSVGPASSASAGRVPGNGRRGLGQLRAEVSAGALVRGEPPVEPFAVPAGDGATAPALGCRRSGAGLTRRSGRIRRRALRQRPRVSERGDARIVTMAAATPAVRARRASARRRIGAGKLDAWGPSYAIRARVERNSRSRSFIRARPFVTCFRMHSVPAQDEGLHRSHRAAEQSAVCCSERSS